MKDLAGIEFPLAAEIGLALIVAALIVTIVALVLLLMRRRARSASQDGEDGASPPSPRPTPSRRRKFGPTAQTDSETPAPLAVTATADDDLPAFVTAARSTAPAQDPAPAATPPFPFARPLPPIAPTPAISPAIARVLAQAIVFRQSFPPEADPVPCFYGGVPRVPAAFEWPSAPHTDHPGSGLPLHFLMQVDCAALPAEARHGLLPASGALLFFADLASRPAPGALAGRVIWLPDADNRPWAEVAPPQTLPPAHRDEASAAWPWVMGEDDAGDAPQILPRWPFTPTLITLAHPQGEQHLTWPEGPLTADALLAAQGSPVAVYALSPNDFAPGADGQMNRPWAGFPHDWLAIQTLSAMLAREASRATRTSDRSIWPDLPVEERRELLARIASECGEWHGLARTKRAFAPLADPVRAAFWEWFSQYAPLARLIAPRGCALAVETTLHALPARADQFPQDLIARLAYRHALAVRTAARIHARIPDRLLAAPSQTETDQSERARQRILLLELSADEALGRHLGDHVLQFWISPEALAAQAFETAELIVATI